MTRPQTPHPIPQHLRDDLMVELTARPLSAANRDVRDHVRRIATDAYAGGFADGRALQQSIESTERELARANALEGDREVHVWQTIRLISVGDRTIASDSEETGYEGQVVVRCACGLRATLSFGATGLILPLCPESPEQRKIDRAFQ